MQKLITFTLALASIFSFNAQQEAPPQGINYQAVAIDNSGKETVGIDVAGKPVAEKEIRVRFSILSTSETGTLTFREVHLVTTDAYGLFNTVIGQGIQDASPMAFNQIDWSTGYHFLKVEIDITGGTDYVDMGTQKLLSVPYALYSKYADMAGNGIDSVTDNGDGTLTFTYIDGSTYITSPLTGLTGPQGLTGATGPQGPAGLAGLNGQDGLSAYEIWIAEGNTGTEADFLNAIIGSQGPQGVQGPSGANGTGIVSTINNGNGTYTLNYTDGSSFTTANLTGPQGPQGPIGLTGPQGLQGLQGPTGATGPQGTIGLTGPAGAQGLQGTAGANGTNGQNTLVKTTTEAAGANCVIGGVKIEYGLDANSNGMLDLSEINTSMTNFVCNGAVGATGPQGIQGPQGTQGPIGITGPQGPIGLTGPQGLQGPQGTAGINGQGGVTTAGNNVTITGTGTSIDPYVVNATDNVDDSDSDPTNEFQALSLSNDTLYLSNGNSVFLGGISGNGSSSSFGQTLPSWIYNTGSCATDSNFISTGNISLSGIQEYCNFTLNLGHTLTINGPALILRVSDTLRINGVINGSAIVSGNGDGGGGGGGGGMSNPSGGPSTVGNSSFVKAFNVGPGGAIGNCSCNTTPSCQGQPGGSITTQEAMWGVDYMVLFNGASGGRGNQGNTTGCTDVAGGLGGAGLVIICDVLELNGSINLSGGNGQGEPSSCYYSSCCYPSGGGGGGGGTCVINAENVINNSNNINVLGGNGGSAAGNCSSAGTPGGKGGDGAVLWLGAQ
jgi:hypothetical protein